MGPAPGQELVPWPGLTAAATTAATTTTATATTTVATATPTEETAASYTASFRHIVNHTFDRTSVQLKTEHENIDFYGRQAA